MDISNEHDTNYVEDMQDDEDLSILSQSQRQKDVKLPKTVTVLDSEDGGKIYLVGTAHFSKQSQLDVAKTIESTVPDVVLLELCSSRTSILQLDEETIMREANNLDLSKVMTIMKQEGTVQGALHLMLLRLSAHVTKKLGMAPGGEFRQAYKHAQRIEHCRVVLGDRPIRITLKRALGSMNLWQKIRMAWYLLTSDENISQEDVERCKERDLLEQLLHDMAGEYPQLSRVFVHERDRFLAHSLKLAAKSSRSCKSSQQDGDSPHDHHNNEPVVVVGVVGIGHVPGIVRNWNEDIDINSLLFIPPDSGLTTAVRWSVRLSLLSAVGYALFRVSGWTYRLLKG